MCFQFWFSCVPTGIVSFAVGLKICTITAGTKNKSIIKKNRKKHDKIVLLPKTKLNSVEVLISSALINPYICHNEFVCSYDTKGAIKYL